MNILPQILGLSDTNLLINQFIFNVKDRLHSLIDDFTYNYNKIRYSDIFLSLQDLTNNFNITFLTSYFEALDNKFKRKVKIRGPCKNIN